MCKKIGIAAIVVVAGLFVLNKTKLGSWCGYAWHTMKEKIELTIPPEEELKRLKYELSQLDPEIGKNKDTLARRLVEQEEMKVSIKNAEKNLEERHGQILAAKNAIDSGVTKVSYKNRTVSAETAKKLVVKDFEAWESAKAAVETRKKLFAIREKAVEESRKQLANWESQRDMLSAEIENLQARLETIKQQEAAHEIADSFDNSRLTNFKESIKELKHNLRVREKRLEMEGETVSSTSSPEDDEAVDKVWNRIGSDERPNSKVAGK